MSNDYSLKSRIAVVTGASSGIGAATALRLAEGGASVALLGRRADRLTELAEKIGDRALAVPVDVTDTAAVTEAVQVVRQRLGRPDLVVANAGVMLGAPFDTGEVSEWDTMLDVNIAGLLATARGFVDDLTSAAADGRADLVLVGSSASKLVFPGYAVYSATKAAVNQLGRILRAELGPRGVRVSTIEPGITATELGADMADATTRAALGEMRAAIEMMRPEDIAEAIAFGASAPARVNLAELLIVPTQMA
ncbi:SDR family oxidoreductase [Kutzneria sp. CA-103260]|uniref:SDR family oxidoreductase n=1 Tax=Kutzneria sp. CA-103260 TaxID=2802641 RepID=UPI001BA96DE8|nr:SDR family oxidoreductase [Kutzneria sp. CA-103260]